MLAADLCDCFLSTFPFSSMSHLLCLYLTPLVLFSHFTLLSDFLLHLTFFLYLQTRYGNLHCTQNYFYNVYSFNNTVDISLIMLRCITVGLLPANINHHKVTVAVILRDIQLDWTELEKKVSAIWALDWKSHQKSTLTLSQCFLYFL